MPFVLILIGVLFLIVAIENTQGEAFDMLRAEFSGNNSFVVFASGIVILGALAYIRPIRPVAFGLIGLILLGLLLANRGFFAQLNAALRNPVAPARPAATPIAPGMQPAINGPSVPFSVPTPALPGFEGLPSTLPVPGL